MLELTIGYVAGAIAAAIFVARVWSPNVLTFILSGILKESNTAATWTVASHALQRSHWSWVLQTDGQRSHGVRKDVIFLTWFITLMSFLITLAGVVTPLGLYEAFLPADSIHAPFVYAKDKSSFAYGTPPRSNLPFNRICSTSYGNWPCPFTDTVVYLSQDARWTNTTFPYGYHLDIPKVLLEAYSSGTGNSTTISNAFDIEWRRFQSRRNAPDEYNNGSTYLVGSARIMESLALRDDIQPVEGLLVDSHHGGIGFRNHTLPRGFRYGVSWSEEHLFIEPETACVNTNLTIDFQIIENATSAANFANMSLTDRGGFANLVKEYPRINLTDTQRNPKLQERAYKAAWMTNAYTALYYNITNPSNEAKGTKSFSYLNSKVGDRYLIPNQQLSGNYDLLSITGQWDAHLATRATASAGADVVTDLPDATNPFEITSSNFTDIGLICSGAGITDYANITNILVNCGLMKGIPRRVDDGGSPILFDAGSKWSQPLYACATAVRATIKTVYFTSDGTDELSNLKVVSVNRTFLGDGKKPLWGVEKTNRPYRINDIPLLWGILDDRYENHPNISTVRQESLYLPGLIDTTFTRSSLQRADQQNLPASTFYKQALGGAYYVKGDNDMTTADYSGGTNMALWAKWQDLSSNATAASMIPNLIFTDYAAASVVGTKGILGRRNQARANDTPILVTGTARKIRYRLVFAIPALLALMGLILMTIGALITMIFHHHNFEVLRKHLHKLSPGRIFTTFLHPELGGMSASSGHWSRSTGKTVINVSGDYPSSETTATIPPQPTFEDNKEMSKQPYVAESSVSEGPTERDQFLGHPSSPPIPGPYSDVNRRS